MQQQPQVNYNPYLTGAAANGINQQNNNNNASYFQLPAGAAQQQQLQLTRPQSQQQPLTTYLPYNNNNNNNIPTLVQTNGGGFVNASSPFQQQQQLSNNIPVSSVSTGTGSVAAAPAQSLPIFQYSAMNASAASTTFDSQQQLMALTQPSAAMHQMRADRRVYRVDAMKFGHKKTHFTTTVIGTKLEDTIHSVYVMFRVPALYHKDHLPSGAACSASKSRCGSDDESSECSDESQLTHPKACGPQQRRGSTTTTSRSTRRHAKSRRGDCDDTSRSSDGSSSEDDEECLKTAAGRLGAALHQKQHQDTRAHHQQQHEIECEDDEDFDPYQEPWIRRVDRFARVAIKKAVLKKNGNRLCSTYSVVTEIMDNIFQWDQDNWDRIGRYGDDNLCERTLDSGDYAYYIADLRFPFTDPKSGGGLPNFLFGRSGFELEIEWESLDNLIEWSDPDCRPFVLDGRKEVSSKDVTAEIKVFSSTLSENTKKMWSQRIKDDGKLSLNWDEYVPSTQFVKNLPVHERDTEDTRCRAFSLSKFLTGSAKGILFFVKREINHVLKRHFDFTGVPCGRKDDPICQYRLTRGNVDLIEWTDAFEARTINFEREFQGRSPKDLRVYYENLENLETKGFLDVHSQNDVKLEVMFQKSIGKVFFHMFVQVINVINISPIDPLNPNSGFQIDSSYYKNQEAVERLTGLLYQDSQPYMNQLRQQQYSGGGNYAGY